MLRTTCDLRLTTYGLIAILTLFLAAGCSRPEANREYARTVMLMGTFVQVKAYTGGLSRSGVDRIMRDALKEARQLEERLSVFNAYGEAVELNTKKELKASPDLFAIIGTSKRMSLLTDGKFDITVAPVLKADGFYKDMPSGIRERIPDDDSGVGWENIVMDPADGMIRLKNNAWVDLSGIAKGYIVDRVSFLLKNKGVKEFLVNAGGDVYCTYKNSGENWTIGLRRPAERDIIMALEIKNMAVATSGDYENVIVDEETGEVTSHIIDPIDKKARPEEPSSVTVIAPTCAEADALATGMMAMGGEKAVALADKLKNIEVIVVERRGGEYRVSFSKNAEDFVKKRWL